MKQITEQVERTLEEKVAMVSEDIAKLEANPVLEHFGKELGIAKLVRDGRAFRIFVKEVQQAKSGKATLVEMRVFVSVEGKEFALVRGHTYLPNFVLQNNDVYWIVENKVENKLTNNPSRFSISAEYIPKEYNIRWNFWSEENNESAEDRAKDHLSFLRKFKETLEEDIVIRDNPTIFKSVMVA